MWPLGSYESFVGFLLFFFWNWPTSLPSWVLRPTPITCCPNICSEHTAILCLQPLGGSHTYFLSRVSPCGKVLSSISARVLRHTITTKKQDVILISIYCVRPAAWARRTILFCFGHIQYTKWKSNVKNKSWRNADADTFLLCCVWSWTANYYLRGAYAMYWMANASSTPKAEARIDDTRLSTGYLYIFFSGDPIRMLYNYIIIMGTKINRNKAIYAPMKTATTKTTTEWRPTHLRGANNGSSMTGNDVLCAMRAYSDGQRIYWPTRKFRCGRCLPKIDRGVSIYIYGIWSYWFFPFCVVCVLAYHPDHIRGGLVLIITLS